MTVYRKASKYDREDILKLITLEEIKIAANIADDFYDEQLTSLLFEAFEIAERYTNRIFILRRVVMERDDGKRHFYLPFGNIVKVDNVTADGNKLDKELYQFNELSEKIKILKSYNTVFVQYSAGVTELPDVVKRALKMMVTTAFSMNQDISIGKEIFKSNIRSLNLLDQVRLYHE